MTEGRPRHKTRKAHADPSRDLPAEPGGEQIYRDLYGAILDQRLPPGTKLTEESLARVFGVSRTMIRNAILRLASDNIVLIRRNRGAVVASPSIEEAREIFEARRVVERALTMKLAETLTPTQVEQLRDHIAQEVAAHAAGDRQRSIRLSGEFHLRLGAMAGNAVLHGFLQELVSRTSLIIALYERPSMAPCANDEHQQLLDALRTGDPDRAAATMIDHLQRCEDRLSLVPEATEIDIADVFRDRLRAGGK